MEIAAIVAVLQDAIADPSFQLRIAVDRLDEAADLLVPGFRRAVLEFVPDHEVLHVTLPVRVVLHHLRAGCDPASMDKIDSMDFFGVAPMLFSNMEETTWPRKGQRRFRRAPVRSRPFRR